MNKEYLEKEKKMKKQQKQGKWKREGGSWKNKAAMKYGEKEGSQKKKR